MKLKKLLCTAVIAAALMAMSGTAQAAVSDECFLIRPTGMFFTEKGLFVADEGRNAIIYLENGNASVFAGYTLPETAGQDNGGHMDGTSELALFNEPFDIAMWNGGLLVTDAESHCIRWVRNGLVRTLAGTENGRKDGYASRAQFSYPRGIVGVNDQEIYIADSGNGLIRKIDLDGKVTTYLTSFDEPCGLCYVDGVFYITDMGAHLIYTYDVKKDLVLLVGGFKDDQGDSVSGYKDGKAEEALFNCPMGIAADEDGTIYVADTGNSAIRIIKNGEVSTLLRGAGDGDDPVLVSPTGLELRDNVLYISDTFTGSVYAYKLDE